MKTSETQEKPEAPDWLIENITEASKNARSIYFLYIGFLAYCVLTVASTSDRAIILNEAVRLPIVNRDIPLDGFFITAPLLAIFVFVYFQLYLQRLKGLITDLRTNYAPIAKRRLYPWMLNIAEDPEPEPIGSLQRLIVQFSLWWSLPIVLSLIAFWFVKKHDPILSYILGLSPLVGIVIVLFFWCRYEPVPRHPRETRRHQQGFIRQNPGKTVLFSIEFLFVLFLFIVIPISNQGRGIIIKLGHQILVDVPEKAYEGIYWRDLQGVHLEGAELIGAFLRQADLYKAHLKKAILIRANLRGANLEDTKLQNALMERANLREANLTNADLREVDLENAILEKAELFRAEMQKAILSKANLTKVVMIEAKLHYAWLQEAKLIDADLRFASLENAVLKDADLKGADLRGARNLTCDQLRSAKNWEKSIREEVHKCDDSRNNLKTYEENLH